MYSIVSVIIEPVSRETKTHNNPWRKKSLERKVSAKALLIVVYVQIKNQIKLSKK